MKILFPQAGKPHTFGYNNVLVTNDINKFWEFSEHCVKFVDMNDDEQEV